ncbi:murein biosynthesis integral membrane protein MurJ [Wenjunlia tyrosinilytica]|uniref:murein biosynthesis integral membrane protein MurJ n=1 Tax=Wenjunlia tyrosinilytica TaxID=1544741 RepID=UPI001E2F3B3F|nr:murein biosynthesis integral membrane protein MurJ [Wenjunlia tyrosinilytica]
MPYSQAPQGPAPYGQGPQGQDSYAQDPYLQQTYADPYRTQTPPGPDPVAAALHDRAAHPPPAPGAGYPDATQQLPAPDPRLWAAPPQGEPAGPVERHLPYGDRETTDYVGVDELMSAASEDGPQPDAYAHLFRDQRPGATAPPVPMPPGAATATADPASAEPEPARPESTGGRAGGILKSSALMAAGTLVSRITGFVRTLVMAAAIGLATLGDVYQVAMVLPTMIYILTIGGGLNSVFVPQLVRAMKEDDDGGEAYANRLLTLVMVILGGIVAVTVVAAPLLIRMMSNSVASDPVQMEVAVTFARFCLPTIFFMGVHVVMGQILNARGRFGAMMWTPVLNNIVVIFAFSAFLWVYGPFSSTHMDSSTITPEGVRLLGVGTLLGLVVQALSMLPYLREAGFRFRPRFDWRGHGLGKAAKLAKWTFLFVLANQAGLIVVTQLATLAGKKAHHLGFDGTGITAYNNALAIWQMPQAIITVSVMAAVLPRISRAAADGDPHAVRDDISYGLRTSAVAIVPAAFLFLAVGVPLCTLMYSSAGVSGARSTGFVLMGFGLGLIPFSVQYVVLRGFYAYEDTRTPFYNTVIVAASNAALSAVCYLVLPARWAVAGMAAAYGAAYAIGVGVAVKRLKHRLGGDIDGARILRTYARLVGACLPSAAVAAVFAYAIVQGLGSGALGSLVAVCGGGLALIALFLVIGKRMRIDEMTALVGMVRGKLGR